MNQDRSGDLAAPRTVRQHQIQLCMTAIRRRLSLILRYREQMCFLPDA